ncbi:MULTISPECIES: hypothetical protein [unclassified Mucilaginibacter]|nr:MULTISPECIES: hypothetical protein [unclassified Mucilaginibacter]MEB0278908.1 hypothetical protein [Mucilaginibacter sp. 10B2]MEB0302889.1 hypothetical protein [Mucilaginibacter sp. 5C4]WPX22090.1 hypothetical protein RHM67_12445 [Mucilaginibacter sp. 5C4]
MKNTIFKNIFDAYQLVAGAKMKAKNFDEIYDLGQYDEKALNWICCC